MELTIYYDEHCISTKIHKSVKVSEIVNGVKAFLNEKNVEFFIVDENKNALPFDKMIVPDKSQKELYLFKIQSFSNKEEKKDKMLIETMIMNATKGKKPLVNVQKNKASYDPKEIIDLEDKEERDNNVNESFDIFRFLDSLSHRVNEENNNSIAPNESHLSTLKEMGFPEEEARNALIQSRNNLARATDLLIQGNEVHNEPQGNNNNPLSILDELF